MSHRNYIPFHCLTSNILKENWVFFFFFLLLLVLLVMCKTVPTTLQATSRWQVSGLVKKLENFLGWLTVIQMSRVCLTDGQASQPAGQSPH